MSRVLSILCFLLLLGCTKEQQQQAETNILIDLITSGQWKVTSYVKGTTDLTASFSSYSFQFKKDNTVDAISNGMVTQTGTWNGDILTRTVTAAFRNPDSTLNLLNGTWLISHSTTTYVIASQSNNGETSALRLDKK